MSDQVNKPAHYNQGGVECIDAMAAAFGVDAVQLYARVAAFKYIWRANEKGATEQDVRKAIWYLRFSIGDDPRRDPDLYFVPGMAKPDLAPRLLEMQNAAIALARRVDGLVALCAKASNVLELVGHYEHRGNALRDAWNEQARAGEQSFDDLVRELRGALTP